MNEIIDLVEEYDETGKCISRKANGIELGGDDFPTVQILYENVRSVTTKKFLTPQEALQKYGYKEI